MLFTIRGNSETDRRKLYDKIKTLKDKNYSVEINVLYENRSMPQNRYYFGVVLEILANEFGYEKLEIHEILKMKFNPKIKTLPNNDTAIYPGSTANMNKPEFEDYLEKVRIWALRDFNIIIPLPNEPLPRL